VHLRFEVDNLEGVADALSGIADGSVRLLAFNDHTPSIARKLDRPAEVAKYTSRVGLDPVEFRELTLAAMERRDEVPAVRERLAAAARAAGIAMLSHDDSSIAERDAHRALGARISEFPTSREVAESARRAGDHVVMGAPNVVRGGSHIGWASAAPLAEEGLVTILASDYVWPALLEAALVLEERGRLTPGEAWALVSANPAEAAGLADRGRLAPGLRGDVVLLDAAARRVVAAFAEGRLAFLAAGAAERLR
jgi:alpha-D-ribose 1-methylphosphonate 5-triphosphate diphosphatase